jgi:beta-lactamase superfamily II metal-dependent hydrolase
MAELKISFLNVGHGDFCYCETPFNQTMIIDCGSGDVVPSKFLNKVSIINELQISHPHTDHFLDIEEISKKTIKSFRCPNPNSFDDKSIGWKKSDESKIKKLKELHKNIKTDNDAITVGNGFRHLVWCPKHDGSDPNLSSLITLIGYKGVNILMAGDLTSECWDEFLKNQDFRNAIKDTTILKAPHHGRKNGCSEELFKYISPKLCIISDKSLEKDNTNTASTDWYTKRASGCNIANSNNNPRYVLTTRNDNSIFIKVDDKGTWWVYRDTNWLK